MTGLTCQLRVYKNNLPFAKQWLHGVILDRHSKRALTRNVCLDHGFRMDDARRLIARDHLFDLMGLQERHCPHGCTGGAIPAASEFKHSLREWRTARSKHIRIDPKISRKAFPDSRILGNLVF